MSITQKKGFTLIELVFVLVLLLIIMSIIVVTYPGLLTRMKIKSDIASAAQLTHAVRTWYVDYSSDSALKDAMTSLGTPTMGLTEIEGLDKYINVYIRPYSLVNENNNMIDDQKFFVGMIGDGVNAKIIVTIGTEGIDVSSESVVNYDGKGSGVVYIER